RRRSREGEQAEVTRAATRALGWLGLYAVPALVVGTALAALSQAAEASDVPLLSALGDPLQRALVGTRYGYVFGGRLLGALALGAMLPLLARAPRSVLLRAVALAFSAALLLTLGLGAHAAAAPILTPLVI